MLDAEVEEEGEPLEHLANNHRDHLPRRGQADVLQAFQSEFSLPTETPCQGVVKPLCSCAQVISSFKTTCEQGGGGIDGAELSYGHGPLTTWSARIL